MNKEQIYDDTIAPLIDQIVAICQEHKIPMVASFHIPIEANEDLSCSTALLDDDYNPPSAFIEVARMIVGEFPFSVAE